MVIKGNENGENKTAVFRAEHVLIEGNEYDENKMKVSRAECFEYDNSNGNVINTNDLNSNITKSRDSENYDGSKLMLIEGNEYGETKMEVPRAECVEHDNSNGDVINSNCTSCGVC